MYLQFEDFVKDWKNQDHVFKIETSGSTGLPKTIVLDRTLLIFSANQTAKAIHGIINCSVLCCLPNDKMGGFMQLVRAAIWQVDCSIVPPSANPMLQLDIEHCFENISISPMQLDVILQDVNSIEKLKKFKVILVGGAAMSTELEQLAIENQIQNIFFTYGMTETLSHVALRKIGEANFTALQGVELKLDEHQCLQVKSAITQNQWLNTNDLAILESENTFKILGRADNLINSGGVKFVAELLEMQLAKYIKVPFFIGKTANELLGDAITLFIESKATIDLSFLNLKLTEQFGKYAKIKAIVEQEILLNKETGKILRNQ